MFTEKDYREAIEEFRKSKFQFYSVSTLIIILVLTFYSCTTTSISNTTNETYKESLPEILLSRVFDKNFIEEADTIVGFAGAYWQSEILLRSDGLSQHTIYDEHFQPELVTAKVDERITKIVFGQIKRLGFEDGTENKDTTEYIDLPSVWITQNLNFLMVKVNNTKKIYWFNDQIAFCKELSPIVIIETALKLSTKEIKKNFE